MEFIVQLAKDWGPFVALVGWVLYTNDKREKRYLNIIDTLSDELKNKLVSIENMLRNKKGE